MYKNILLPTDGSELSKRAIAAGVRLASAVGAKVTGVHVTPKLAATGLEQWAVGEKGRRSRLVAIFDEQAKHYLGEIEAAAQKAGVRCERICVAGDSPYVQILKTRRTPVATSSTWPLTASTAHRRCCSAARRSRC